MHSASTRTREEAATIHEREVTILRDGSHDSREGSSDFKKKDVTVNELLASKKEGATSNKTTSAIPVKAKRNPRLLRLR